MMILNKTYNFSDQKQFTTIWLALSLITCVSFLLIQFIVVYLDSKSNFLDNVFGMNFKSNVGQIQVQKSSNGKLENSSTKRIMGGKQDPSSGGGTQRANSRNQLKTTNRSKNNPKYKKARLSKRRAK